MFSDILSHCCYCAYLQHLFPVSTSLLLTSLILIYPALGTQMTKNITLLCKIFANPEARMYFSM